jgi:hypothetical protein
MGAANGKASGFKKCKDPSRWILFDWPSIDHRQLLCASCAAAGLICQQKVAVMKNPGRKKTNKTTLNLDLKTNRGNMGIPFQKGSNLSGAFIPISAVSH